MAGNRQRVGKGHRRSSQATSGEVQDQYQSVQCDPHRPYFFGDRFSGLGFVSYQQLFQAKDPQKVAITDRQIALAMPLWVHPLDPRPKRRLRLAALAIPAIASVLTLLVIFYCWSIPDAFPGLSGADYWKYVVYYLLSAGLFIYRFRRLSLVVKNYSVKMPAAETADATS